MLNRLSILNHRSGARSLTMSRTFVLASRSMLLSLQSVSTGSPIHRAVTAFALDFSRILIAISRLKLRGDTLVSYSFLYVINSQLFTTKTVNKIRDHSEHKLAYWYAGTVSSRVNSDVSFETCHLTNDSYFKVI